MSTTTNIHSHGVIVQVLHIFVCWALLTSLAYCQEKQKQPEKLAYGADMANVPDAIARVKSG